jgi:hypothetical protein
VWTALVKTFRFSSTLLKRETSLAAMLSTLGMRMSRESQQDLASIVTSMPVLSKAPSFHRYCSVCSLFLQALRGRRWK